MRSPLFAVGDHVRVLGVPRCGTVRTAFQSNRGGWAYGVLYDDHAIDYPIGDSGHAFAEQELERIEEVAA